MSEAAKRIGKVEKVLCASCNNATDHTIRGAYDTSWHNDEDGEHGSNEHDLMSCNGCDEVTYRDTGWATYEPEGTLVRLYPPRGTVAAPLRQPKDYDELPAGSPLESVYRQTISAFAQKLTTLAGAGVRLLIEGVCRERGVNDGPVRDRNTGAIRRRDNLEGKINGLFERGLVSQNQADFLHQIRFLGNDAAHELDIPTVATVAAAIDIVEHIFDQVYELPAKAQRLQARIRPGAARAPAAPAPAAPAPAAPAPGAAPAATLPAAPPPAPAAPPAVATAPPRTI